MILASTLSWIMAKPAVIGACGPASDRSAVEQRPTPEGGSGSCPEVCLEEMWCHEVLLGLRSPRRWFERSRFAADAFACAVSALCCERIRLGHKEMTYDPPSQK